MGWCTAGFYVIAHLEALPVLGSPCEQLAPALCRERCDVGGLVHLADCILCRKWCDGIAATEKEQLPGQHAHCTSLVCDSLYATMAGFDGSALSRGSGGVFLPRLLSGTTAT